MLHYEQVFSSAFGRRDTNCCSINWHFTCQLARIYENFREQYFKSIQNTSRLKDSQLDSYDKYDVKEKLNDLVKFCKAM